ncbi:TspO/MBR family protein [Qipengyuania marisflavi]|uniref:Tryptophan-rich sensory protein n=1 Tax=Qipengyuania marisflavi TaxID=2486356 RepID=A0A5S3PA79_9SPHN|nr:TspO/MBR family protein [Qipengyuania marisflavi]TMM50263.1 tryptophan-rich sensory protein [Qipengyuania marisflavi]
MNMLASRGQLRASFIRWALFIVPLVMLLGFLSGRVAGSGPGNPWFDALVKPGIYPPPAAFGIVWSILYLMMGVALAMVCAAWGARGRKAAIWAFVVQMALNLAWTPVFFAAHQLTGALAVIILLDIAVVITIMRFWKVRPVAGMLLVPYLAWILFATALNWQFLELNPDADGANPSGAVERVRIGG